MLFTLSVKETLMRRLIAVCLVAVLMTACVTDVQAARRVKRTRRVPVMQTSNGGGVFARLMELERRKNEWLFGR